jgi:hypothetical protein
MRADRYPDSVPTTNRHVATGQHGPDRAAPGAR